MNISYVVWHWPRKEPQSLHGRYLRQAFSSRENKYVCQTASLLVQSCFSSQKWVVALCLWLTCLGHVADWNKGCWQQSCLS